jgi:anti-sigma-K factor RskA
MSCDLDPRLRDLLAGEYVLGMLKGSARRRFENLLHDDSRLRRDVRAWERRLALLAVELPAIAPPREVWRKISREITPAPKRRLTQRVIGLLPAAALPRVVAAAALLVVAVLLVPFGGVWNVQPPLHGLTIAEQGAQPMWLVRHDPSGHLHVRAVSPPTLEPGTACMLWLISPGGEVHGLGPLPENGEALIKLPLSVGSRLHEAFVVVSVEPAGTVRDTPSGRLLYQGAWRG